MFPNIRLHLILSGVGVLVGLSAFIVFSFVYNNYDAGIWSLLSGVLAAICFLLHWLKAKETLDKWHGKIPLRNINVVGFMGAVAGIPAMIWYLFVTFYYKKPIMPISESTVIPAIWSMICGKWGILLMYHSRKYEIILEEGSVPIIQENNA